jgi:hypothetical protein
MLSQVLVHLEHSYPFLAEDFLQRFIGQYLAAIFRVLQLVSLDIGPDFTDDFTPSYGSAADNCGQFLCRLQRLLQGVRLAAGLWPVSHGPFWNGRGLGGFGHHFLCLNKVCLSKTPGLFLMYGLIWAVFALSLRRRVPAGRAAS